MKEDLLELKQDLEKELASVRIDRGKTEFLKKSGYRNGLIKALDLIDKRLQE